MRAAALLFLLLLAGCSGPDLVTDQALWSPLGHDVQGWMANPPAERLVVIPTKRPAELWNTRTGNRVAVLSDQPGPMGPLDFSPSGSLFITGRRIPWDMPSEQRDDALRVWNSADGKLQRVLRPALGARIPEADLMRATDWEVIWLDEGRILIQLNVRENPARASFTSTLAVVAVSTGEILRISPRLEISEALVPSPDRRRALATRLTGIGRSPEGKVSRSGLGTTSEVDLLDLETLRLLTRFGGGSNREIVHATWSPDGRWIATAAEDHIVRFWSADGTLQASTAAHRDWILNVCFSPDSRQLATACADGMGSLWEVSTGRLVSTLAAHPRGMNTAQYSKDGDVLVTAGEDGRLRVHDRQKTTLRWEAGHAVAVRHVRIADDSSWVEATLADREVRRWSLPDGRLLTRHRAPEDAKDLAVCGSSLLIRRADQNYELRTPID